MENISIFGELLIDHKSFNNKRKPPQPGGPPFFMSRLFNSCPTKVTIIASYGADFFNHILPDNVVLLPKKPPRKINPRYYLDYQNGDRKLRVNNVNLFAPILPKELGANVLKTLKENKLVFFSSTMPYYTPGIIRKWKQFLIDPKMVLLAQGWMRTAEENGRIKPQDEELLMNFFKSSHSLFDAVVFSDQDHQTKVIKMIPKVISAKTITAVTQGIKGATIYFKGKKLILPTYWPVNEKEKNIDTTGSGDRWAAVFAYRFFIDKQTIYQAALEAHKIASLCLTPA